MIGNQAERRLLLGHDALDEQLRIEEERQRFEIQERPAFEVVPVGQEDPQPLHFPADRADGKQSVNQLNQLNRLNRLNRWN